MDPQHKPPYCLGPNGEEKFGDWYDKHLVGHPAHKEELVRESPELAYRVARLLGDQELADFFQRSYAARRPASAKCLDEYMRHHVRLATLQALFTPPSGR